MIEFTLPFPVSVNDLYLNRRGSKGKGRIKTARYQTWINAAGWELAQQRPAAIKGPYTLSAVFGKPDNRKRDLGNLEKGLHDFVVAHRVVEDDSLCQAIFLAWGNQPGCRVTIRPAEVPA